jgi:hypothetical protein
VVAPISYRPIKNINHHTFSSDLHTTVVDPFLHSFMELVSYELDSGQATSPHDFDSLMLSYHSTLQSTFHLHAPLKTIRPKRTQSIPWWSSEIAETRKQLRSCERRWRLSKSVGDRSLYVQMKRTFHQLLARSKSEYARKVIQDSQHDSRGLWRALNKTLGRSRVCSLPDNVPSDELSSRFNDFFLLKVRDLRLSLLQTSVTTNLSHCETSYHVVSKLEDFSPASHLEVKKIVIQSKKTYCDLDPMPSCLFSKHLQLMLPLLTMMVNLSLHIGMPSCYKMAYVKPLLKKRGLEKNALDNYRPVSNVSFFSKVVERVVARRLNDHLVANGFLDDRQHAYKVSHSCETALLTITNAGYRAMDESRLLVLVLLDLSAAFDLVDHRLLIDKLFQLGVSGSALTWFKTYLNGRFQSVVINEDVSPAKSLISGVPQGSVLGPILFVVYLFGIGEIFKKYNIEYVLYADDIQLYVSTSLDRLSETIQNIEACIIEVRSWLASIFLKLNEKKTEFILIGNPSLLNRCSPVVLRVGEYSLHPASSVRSLGVQLDKHLTMEEHIKKISATSFMYLRLISRVRRSLNRRHQLMLTNALVLSRVDFCGSLLIDVSAKLLKRLLIIQNAVVRMVMALKKRDHITPHAAALGLLPIPYRLRLHVACLIFSMLRTGQPKILASYLVTSTSSRVTRSQTHGGLLSQHASTSVGQKAFNVFAPRLWNSLPLAIKDLKTLGCFRENLRKHFIEECNV